MGEACLRALDTYPERGDEIARRLYAAACDGWLPEEHFNWEAAMLDVSRRAEFLTVGGKSFDRHVSPRKRTLRRWSTTHE